MQSETEPGLFSGTGAECANCFYVHRCFLYCGKQCPLCSECASCSQHLGGRTCDTSLSSLRSNVNIEETAAKPDQLPHVRSIRIITEEAALERLKARLGNQAAAVKNPFRKNPLPPSLEILVDKAESVSTVARDLVAISEIQDVVYAGKLAEKVTKLSRFASQFSLIMLLLPSARAGLFCLIPSVFPFTLKKKKLGLC